MIDRGAGVTLGLKDERRGIGVRLDIQVLDRLEPVQRLPESQEPDLDRLLLGAGAAFDPERQLDLAAGRRDDGLRRRDQGEGGPLGDGQDRPDRVDDRLARPLVLVVLARDLVDRPALAEGERRRGRGVPDRQAEREGRQRGFERRRENEPSLRLPGGKRDRPGQHALGQLGGQDGHRAFEPSTLDRDRDGQCSRARDRPVSQFGRNGDALADRLDLDPVDEAVAPSAEIVADRDQQAVLRVDPPLDPGIPAELVVVLALRVAPCASSTVRTGSAGDPTFAASTLIA